MKKLILVLITLMLGFFVLQSCKKEFNNEDESQKKIFKNF